MGSTVGDDGPRVVSVSKDFLRAELKELQLTLVEKLATREDVAEVRKEHGALEARHDALCVEVNELKAWRQYLVGLTTSALGLAGVAVTVAFHPWG